MRILCCFQKTTHVGRSLPEIHLAPSESGQQPADTAAPAGREIRALRAWWPMPRAAGVVFLLARLPTPAHLHMSSVGSLQGVQSSRYKDVDAETTKVVRLGVGV
jgi:hypothetical protein